jgi:hypothetical protein
LPRVIRIGTRLIKKDSAATKSSRALSLENKMILMAGPHASCQILRQNIQELLFFGHSLAVSILRIAAEYNSFLFSLSLSLYKLLCVCVCFFAEAEDLFII